MSSIIPKAGGLAVHQVVSPVDADNCSSANVFGAEAKSAKSAKSCSAKAPKSILKKTDSFPNMSCSLWGENTKGRAKQVEFCRAVTFRSCYDDDSDGSSYVQDSTKALSAGKLLSKTRTKDETYLPSETAGKVSDKFLHGEKWRPSLLPGHMLWEKGTQSTLEEMDSAKGALLNLKCAKKWDALCSNECASYKKAEASIKLACRKFCAEHELQLEAANRMPPQSWVCGDMGPSAVACIDNSTGIAIHTRACPYVEGSVDTFMLTGQHVSEEERRLPTQKLSHTVYPVFITPEVPLVASKVSSACNESNHLSFERLLHSLRERKNEAECEKLSGIEGGIAQSIPEESARNKFLTQFQHGGCAQKRAEVINNIFQDIGLDEKLSISERATVLRSIFNVSSSGTPYISRSADCAACKQITDLVDLLLLQVAASVAAKETVSDSGAASSDTRLAILQELNSKLANYPLIGDRFGLASKTAMVDLLQYWIGAADAAASGKYGNSRKKLTDFFQLKNWRDSDVPDLLKMRSIATSSVSPSDNLYADEESAASPTTVNIVEKGQYSDKVMQERFAATDNARSSRLNRDAPFLDHQQKFRLGMESKRTQDPSEEPRKPINHDAYPGYDVAYKEADLRDIFDLKVSEDIDVCDLCEYCISAYRAAVDGRSLTKKYGLFPGIQLKECCDALANEMYDTSTLLGMSRGGNGSKKWWLAQAEDRQLEDSLVQKLFSLAGSLHSDKDEEYEVCVVVDTDADAHLAALYLSDARGRLLDKDSRIPTIRVVTRSSLSSSGDDAKQDLMTQLLKKEPRRQFAACQVKWGKPLYIEYEEAGVPQGACASTDSEDGSVLIVAQDGILDEKDVQGKCIYHGKDSQAASSSYMVESYQELFDKFVNTTVCEEVIACICSDINKRHRIHVGVEDFSSIDIQKIIHAAKKDFKKYMAQSSVNSNNFSDQDIKDKIFQSLNECSEECQSQCTAILTIADKDNDGSEERIWDQVLSSREKDILADHENRSQRPRDRLVDAKDKVLARANSIKEVVAQNADAAHQISNLLSILSEQEAMKAAIAKSRAFRNSELEKLQELQKSCIQSRKVAISKDNAGKEFVKGVDQNDSEDEEKLPTSEKLEKADSIIKELEVAYHRNLARRKECLDQAYNTQGVAVSFVNEVIEEFRDIMAHTYTFPVLQLGKEAIVKLSNILTCNSRAPLEGKVRVIDIISNIFDTVIDSYDAVQRAIDKGHEEIRDDIETRDDDINVKEKAFREKKVVERDKLYIPEFENRLEYYKGYISQHKCMYELGRNSLDRNNKGRADMTGTMKTSGAAASTAQGQMTGSGNPATGFQMGEEQTSEAVKQDDHGALGNSKDGSFPSGIFDTDTVIDGATSPSSSKGLDRSKSTSDLTTVNAAGSKGGMTGSTNTKDIVTSFGERLSRRRSTSDLTKITIAELADTAELREWMAAYDGSKNLNYQESHEDIDTDTDRKKAESSAKQGAFSSPDGKDEPVKEEPVMVQFSLDMLGESSHNDKTSVVEDYGFNSEDEDEYEDEDEDEEPIAALAKYAGPFSKFGHTNDLPRLLPTVPLSQERDDSLDGIGAGEVLVQRETFEPHSFVPIDNPSVGNSDSNSQLQHDADADDAEVTTILDQVNKAATDVGSGNLPVNDSIKQRRSSSSPLAKDNDDSGSEGSYEEGEANLQELSLAQDHEVSDNDDSDSEGAYEEGETNLQKLSSSPSSSEGSSRSSSPPPIPLSSPPPSDEDMGGNYDSNRDSSSSPPPLPLSPPPAILNTGRPVGTPPTTIGDHTAALLVTKQALIRVRERFSKQAKSAEAVAALVELVRKLKEAHQEVSGAISADVMQDGPDSIPAGSSSSKPLPVQTFPQNVPLGKDQRNIFIDFISSYEDMKRFVAQELGDDTSKEGDISAILRLPSLLDGKIDTLEDKDLMEASKDALGNAQILQKYASDLIGRLRHLLSEKDDALTKMHGVIDSLKEMHSRYSSAAEQGILLIDSAAYMHNMVERLQYAEGNVKKFAPAGVLADGLSGTLDKSIQELRRLDQESSVLDDIKYAMAEVCSKVDDMTGAQDTVSSQNLSAAVYNLNSVLEDAKTNQGTLETMLRTNIASFLQNTSQASINCLESTIKGIGKKMCLSSDFFQDLMNKPPLADNIGVIEFNPDNDSIDELMDKCDAMTDIFPILKYLEDIQKMLDNMPAQDVAGIEARIEDFLSNNVTAKDVVISLSSACVEAHDKAISRQREQLDTVMKSSGKSTMDRLKSFAESLGVSNKVRWLSDDEMGSLSTQALIGKATSTFDALTSILEDQNDDDSGTSRSPLAIRTTQGSDVWKDLKHGMDTMASTVANALACSDHDIADALDGFNKAYSKLATDLQNVADSIDSHIDVLEKDLSSRLQRIDSALQGMQGGSTLDDVKGNLDLAEQCLRELDSFKNKLEEFNHNTLKGDGVDVSVRVGKVTWAGDLVNNWSSRVDKMKETITKQYQQTVHDEIKNQRRKAFMLSMSSTTRTPVSSSYSTAKVGASSSGSGRSSKMLERIMKAREGKSWNSKLHSE